jgi:lipopolysaccharide biosynthesis regulator YciM
VLLAEALAQRGGGSLLSKLVSDCLVVSPLHSEGWLAAALHWKHDLVRMSELLEKVTASDPQCVHAHLLEAELHLERRQYAAALFSARNAHALHRSVRSYR